MMRRWKNSLTAATEIMFNPGTVSSYRLIGYENRVLAHRHTVTAFYEVVPASKPTKSLVDELKYVKSMRNSASADEVLTVKVRYKQPGGKESKLLTNQAESSMFSLNSSEESGIESHLLA